MTDFETALDPGAAMYARDIAADAKAVEAIPAAIDLAVSNLKDLLRRNAFDSTAGMFHALRRIGQLLDMRERLTGECKTVEYLLSDDGECFRHIAGFVGDNAGVFDAQGRPLLVGDIVSGTIRNREVKRMVILDSKGASILPQEWMDRHDAVFTEDFSAADMRWANNGPDRTVRCGGCLKEYHAARDRAAKSRGRSPIRPEKGEAR